MADVSSLVVAALGVGGTLGATLIAQRGRLKEFGTQSERTAQERREDREERDLQAKRELYAALNGTARAYFMAGRDAVRALHLGQRLDRVPLEAAREAYRSQYATAQMVLPDLPLRVASEANRCLGIGRVLVQHLESGEDWDKLFQLAREWDSGPITTSVYLLRQALRDDLDVDRVDASELRKAVSQLADARHALQRRMETEGYWPA